MLVYLSDNVQQQPAQREHRHQSAGQHEQVGMSSSSSSFSTGPSSPWPSLLVHKRKHDIELENISVVKSKNGGSTTTRLKQDKYC